MMKRNGILSIRSWRKLNKVVFYIVNKEEMTVRNCTCFRYRDNDFCQIENIVLTDEDARGFFRDFNQRYEGSDREFDDGTIEVSFERVSSPDADILIKFSKEYKEFLNKKEKPLEDWRVDDDEDIFLRDEEDEENERLEKRKVSRKNLFKKTIAIVTGATLITMSTFILKEKLDNNDNVDSLSSKEEVVMASPIVEENQMLTSAPLMVEVSPTPTITPTPTPVATPQVNDSSQKEEFNERKINGIFRLDTGNERETEKYINMVNTYGDEVNKYAKMYGLDPELVLAIGTLERGVHSAEVDYDGGLGLFQIQVAGPWSWVGETVRAYNFETHEYDKFVIDEESVRDISNNIQVGCMILQSELVSANYNVAEAVTAYNYGRTNMDKVLRICSSNTGIPFGELRQLGNTSCWLGYRDYISGGDPTYLEDVFKYIEPNTILSFTKPDGEVVRIAYMNTALENVVNTTIKK